MRTWPSTHPQHRLHGEQPLHPWVNYVISLKGNISFSFTKEWRSLERLWALQSQLLWYQKDRNWHSHEALAHNPAVTPDAEVLHTNRLHHGALLHSCLLQIELFPPDGLRRPTGQGKLTTKLSTLTKSSSQGDIIRKHFLRGEETLLSWNSCPQIGQGVPVCSLDSCQVDTHWSHLGRGISTEKM